MKQRFALPRKQTTKKTFKKETYLTWVFLVILFVTLTIIVLLFFKNRINSNNISQMNVISKTKIFKETNYKVSYPNNWLEKINTKGIVELYNPHFLNNYADEETNISLSDHVYLTAINSNKTSEEYARTMVENDPNYEQTQAYRKFLSSTLASAEVYRKSPEGSLAYILIFSNGKQIITLEVPTHDVSLDDTYNSIVSSFSFTDK